MFQLQSAFARIFNVLANSPVCDPALSPVRLRHSKPPAARRRENLSIAYKSAPPAGYQPGQARLDLQA